MVENSPAVDSLSCKESQPEVTPAHRDAPEMMATNQVDRTLHGIDSEFSGLLQLADQEIKEPPQRWIPVDEMKVDGLRLAGMPLFRPRKSTVTNRADPARLDRDCR